MALQVRGHDILTMSEYITLARALPRAARGGGVLMAMSHGLAVSPIDVYTALEVGARLGAGQNKQANQIIDRASARLKAAFPDEVPA